jgi:dolichol-phosphate mannosyltransferase
MTEHRMSEVPSLSLPAEMTGATILVGNPQPESYVPPTIGERMLTIARMRFSIFKRLISFLIVGGLGALVNIVFFTLTYNRLERPFPGLVAYLAAFVLATEVSLLFNFALNDQITFRQLRDQKRSWRGRCARFHVTSIGGTLLTLAISFSLLHFMHLPALFAQAFALIIATAFNFAFHHLFTYRHVQEETKGAISVAMTEHPFSAEQAAFEQEAVLTPVSTQATNTVLDASLNSAEKPEETEILVRTPLKTLIIIPTYNEHENLPLLLQTIASYAPETDILIVDDNSPDGTGDLAEGLSEQNKHIHVLHRAGKLGLGTAYIAGFQYSIAQGYDAAFEMDADFSHDPRYLPDMLQAIEHADLVIGSRYISGGATPTWSLKRRIISGGGNMFARFVLGIPIHDCTGGFRCYRRHVLESIELDAVLSRGYAFQIELTYRVLRAGFKISEVPIIFMDRRLGVSKMSGDIVIEAVTYVLRERFSRRISPSL